MTILKDELMTQNSSKIVPKVAVVHEWLSTYAGSEKVTETIIKLFNSCKVYATVEFLTHKERNLILGDKKAQTTFIQHLPFSRKYFRYYLPFFPFAIRQHKLNDAELIISSSHAFAHGVKKRKGQIHVSYSHTPMRYIWDMQDLYLKANNMDKGLIAVASKTLAKFLRKWDAKVSKDVDYYISNSQFTANRIKNCYGRTAKVIYPPVSIEDFESISDKSDYYLTASRFVSYKKVELVVEAFTKMPNKKLIVIGDGKQKSLIEKLATPNITIFSHLEFEIFHEYLRKAKAFVFAGEEDFGITMVEAQACGTPVIAYHKGGAAEIVKNGETGLLFKEQSIDSIKNAVLRFENDFNNKMDSDLIRKNAERFSTEVFKNELSKHIIDCTSGQVQG